MSREQFATGMLLLATYLNQERWEDEPIALPSGKAQTVRNLAVVKQWASR